ncbi:MAG: hypothetical protein LAT68_02370 [Cyclobacteriaceae bacterium]|nr:hypothetical protein [Cyclobacteriaceae bacterium]MCH8515149.1 hypothetical protein [Cyclobacteriaceae bacterium]
MNLIKTLLLSICLGFASIVQAQDISIGFNLSYSNPQGSMFVDQGGAAASFGLGYAFDAMFHPENLAKVGVGLAVNGNAVFTSGDNIGAYGLSVFGAKGQYRFFTSNVSPYVGLTTGVSRFSSPDVTINGQELPGARAFSLGLVPEIGIELGSFVMAVSYIVPMNYDVTESQSFSAEGRAGMWQYSLGYRFKTSIR